MELLEVNDMTSKRDSRDDNKESMGSVVLIEQYAKSLDKELQEIADLYYQEGLSRFRIIKWKKIIKDLCQRQWSGLRNAAGLPEESFLVSKAVYELTCHYLPFEEPDLDRLPTWFLKLPKQKETYCAIGFVLKQAPETVEDRKSVV